MTDTQWLAYVRSLLGEITPKFWTPEEIAAYKTVGITTVFSSFWNLLYPIKKKPILINMVTGESLLEYPESWDGFKIVRLENAGTGAKLKYIEDDEFFRWANLPPGTPQRWTFSDEKIMQLPTPNASEANYWRLWYLPEAITLANLPSCLHALVAIEAVLGARIKDDNVRREIVYMKDNFTHSATIALSVAQVQDFGGIRDFDSDEDVD